MKIIKRNGSEADFDLNKIVVAVSKANAACRKEELTQSQIVEIAEYVEFKMSKANRALSVEEIQDIVENQIMAERQILPIIRFYLLLNVIMKR